MAEKQKLVSTGRRKEATARVELVRGSGNITINGKNINDYLKLSTLVTLVKQPLEITSTASRFDVTAKVRGGGVAGQAGAIRLGIAKALLMHNPAYRTALRRHGLLTRDSRVKERKKYGLAKRRKRYQFSKR